MPVKPDVLIAGSGTMYRLCNRPDSHQKLKIGAKHDGTLTAIELTSYGTAGVGTGAGTAGPATNMYKCVRTC